MFTAKRRSARAQGRDTHCAAAYGDDSDRAGEHAPAQGDPLFADQPAIVEALLAEREHPAVVEADAAAKTVGKRGFLRQFDRPARRLSAIAVPRAIDTPRTRARRRHKRTASAAPAGEPTAQDRLQPSEARELFHDLEGEGALAGVDRSIVEGTDHHPALFGEEQPCLGLRPALSWGRRIAPPH